MAQIDADERDYVSLAALRDANGNQNPSRAPGIPQWPSRLCDDWPVGSLVMRASGK